MKITREALKNIVREAMIEENEYQQFFAKALEKAGKSIPQMSDEEKKAFFNKIDSAWQSKGEKKNEGNAFGAAVADAKEKGKDEFEVDGEKFKVESVNESLVTEATDIYVKGRIQITKFAGADELMIQINAPKYKTAGDHIVMTKTDFIQMLKNSPKLLSQLKESVNEEFKHTIYVDTPTQVASKKIAAEIEALAKKGIRSKEIGLKMGFVGNQKAATDAFQKIKNKVYFSLHKEK